MKEFITGVILHADKKPVNRFLHKLKPEKLWFGEALNTGKKEDKSSHAGPG